MESLLALILLIPLALMIICVVLIRNARRESKALRADLEVVHARARSLTEHIGTLEPALTPLPAGHLPARPCLQVPAPPPMRLEAMTDSRRAAGLTVAMKLPVIDTRRGLVTWEGNVQSRSASQPLSVNVGGEVVDLDADTVARIEALQEYVNAGRHDGTVLQRLVEAGFTVVGEGRRESGDHVVASNDTAPVTPAPRTKPTGG